MKIGTIPTEGAAALTLYAKLLLAARGDTAQAAAMAAAAGADTLTDVLKPFVDVETKDAVLAGSTIAWGSSLAGYQTIVSQFEMSLRSLGAFDAMLPLMRRVPLALARLAIVVTGATGNVVGQGAPKPISSLQLAAGDIEPTKATCILVVSDELARLETPQGLLADELRIAVATSTDRVLLPGLIDSSTPSVSASGTDAAHFLADLSAAVASISLSARSRLFLAADPVTVAALALMEGNAFADMTVNGGSIRGVQLVPSDAIERNSSGAQLLLIDASQIAAATATITIDASEHATLQADTAPTDPPNAATVLQSLWQQNTVGMKAERWFAFKRLRENAAVTITGANYGVAT